MNTLVENSFALSTHLLKKDLARARKKEPVEGFLNVVHDGKPSIADYSIEYNGDDTYLVITLGIEPQRIQLSEEKLTFGNRSYLICNCGSKTNILYLKKGVFACRDCHNLTYQSTTINRTSKHGRFLHQQSQVLKLIGMREKMNRIFYKSHYTKRFLHWLGLCSSAGLFDEAMQAWKLQDAVNDYKQ